MSAKSGRSRTDVAFSLETLFGVVADAPSPPRRPKRTGAADHAIEVVLDRAGLRRKPARRR